MVLIRAVRGALAGGAVDKAASIAFWGFLSIFPLVIVLVTLVSFLLDDPDGQARLQDLIATSLPGSADVVRGSLEAVVRLRAPMGLAGAVALVWSGSAWFGSITRAINDSLGLARSMSWLVWRIKQTLLTLAAGILLVVSITLTLTAETAVASGWVFGLRLDAATRVGGVVTGALISFAMFVFVYLAAPFRRQSLRRMLPGALLATLCFELAKRAFVIYLSQVADLQAVYGSLSTVVGLLLWLYIVAWILVLGVEFNIARAEDAAATA